MKLCLSLVSCLLLAAGCKTDSPEPTATAKETTSEPSGRKGRSGKIDFERPSAPNRPQPSLQQDPGTAERGSGDRPDRWEERRERMQERRKERMAELDRDGDGKLSPEELAAARQQRAEEMHGRFDTDGDGKLSPQELGEARMFRRGGSDPAALDTDKNGEISNQELEAGLASMRNRVRSNWDDATGRGSGGRRGMGSAGGEAPGGDAP